MGRAVMGYSSMNGLFALSIRFRIPWLFRYHHVLNKSNT